MMKKALVFGLVGMGLVAGQYTAAMRHKEPEKEEIVMKIPSKNAQKILDMLSLKETGDKHRTKFVETDECLYAIVSPKNLKIFVSDSGMSMAEFARLNPGCMAAINASFFEFDQDSKIVPTGRVIYNGKILSPSCVEIAYGKVNGRDEEAYIKKAAVETDWYYTFHVGQKGAAIEKSKEFEKKYDGDFRGMSLGFECGPLLVSGGKASPEEFLKRKSAEKEFARSGIGIDSHGNVILLASKEKITYAKMAQLLIDAGAVEAIGLDGGPSTSFYSKQREEYFPSSHNIKVSTILFSEK